MSGEEIMTAIDDYLMTLDKKNYKCVNWGDIGCTCLKKVEEIYPDKRKYYEAIIEEAAPENYELAEQISVYMAEQYGIDIDIVCEW